MGWIYDIEYTNGNGTPITVSVGINNPKEVPGARVHWIDSRGKFHDENVAIYTRGVLKDKPKSTVHGCLDKNREPILKISKERATILLADYNAALRRYKAKPTENGFPSLEGKSDSEKKDIYEQMRKKADKFAVNLISRENTPGMKPGVGIYTRDDKWVKSAINKKKKGLKLVPKYVARKARALRRGFGELTETDKANLDELEKHLKKEVKILPVIERNEKIAQKAEKLRNTPGVGVYWDEKTGHLRMGKVKHVMTTEAKNKKKRVGTKLRAYNFVKAPLANPRKSTRKASKKYLAEIDAEYAAEAKARAEAEAKARARAEAEAKARARAEAEAKARAEAKKNFVASKSWGSMTNEEKINHAKKVLNLENPAAMTALKNSKMRNRDKNDAILQKYNSLSDEAKNKHLP